MAETTGIGWCDATFNPWWGCERVSPGCAHCYAADLAKRYGHAETWSEKGDPHTFRFFGDRHWDEPIRWAVRLPEKLGRRPRVFVASMADVFEDHPALVEPRLRLLGLIEATPELDWLLLTKRIDEARDLYYAGEWTLLPNVWVGTSIENQRFTWRADVLREIPAAIRFISAEPLLGSLLAERASQAERLGPDGGDPRSSRSLPGIASSRSALDVSSVATASYDALEGRAGVDSRAPLDLDGIDWLIAGGESGPKARPMRAEWVRELRDECVERGLPFFFKQWGGRTAKAGGKELDGEEWCHFPASLGDVIPA